MIQISNVHNLPFNESSNIKEKHFNKTFLRGKVMHRSAEAPCKVVKSS